MVLPSLLISLITINYATLIPKGTDLFFKLKSLEFIIYIFIINLNIISILVRNISSEPLTVTYN